MIKNIPFPIILASASPRRRELLEDMGLQFQVIPSVFNEDSVDPEQFASLQDYVIALAAAKGRDLSRSHPDSLLISADTVVTLDGQILGKPVDTQDAERMLRSLSGRSHQVISAVSLKRGSTDFERSGADTTTVKFRDLSQEDIEDYIATGSPFDKAGAYGIQDVGAALAERIHGCFYTVLGFPLPLFYRLMKDLLHSQSVQSFSQI